jgi:uncharacterized glyoxalase superfamily protein PhnB
MGRAAASTLSLANLEMRVRPVSPGGSGELRAAFYIIRELPITVFAMLANRSAPPVTVTPVLVYADVRAAVAWLEAAFGFEERVRIGDTHRSQLRVGLDGAVVVADVGADRVAPSDGGVTHLVKVRVPDVDAAFARARERGARVVEELTTFEYGERSGVLEDPGGHRRELTQTVRDVAPEEWGGKTVARW